MTETCPVCGDVVEHRRTERAGSGDLDAGGGAGASFDIDDLCAVEEETRWDRICTAAATDEETEAGGAPVLAIYYHFFGDGE